MTARRIDLRHTATGPHIDTVTDLTADQIDQVHALARAAGTADGAAPFSEQVLLRLGRRGGDHTRHLLINNGDALAGYSYIDGPDATAELCVHPMLRRRGLGRALARATIDARDPARPLRLWAHGDHPSANALAVEFGLDRTRVLWRMRRPLTGEVEAPRWPSGVGVREFVPGADDHAWLALNARAFADHPDQGRWTPDDLRLRMAERWFDPAGFLVAHRHDGGALVGFHWTKVHDCPHHPPIGEVYVLGVDPAAHARGLGTALTLAGLRHLRARGLGQVMLYTDETNDKAISLYRRLGFARWSSDAQFTLAAESHGVAVTA